MTSAFAVDKPYAVWVDYWTFKRHPSPPGAWEALGGLLAVALLRFQKGGRRRVRYLWTQTR